LVFNALISSEYAELTVQCPDIIDKDAWPPNSPDLNPLMFGVGCWTNSTSETHNQRISRCWRQRLWRYGMSRRKKLSENQSSASAGVCALATQNADTLNMNS